ncbi:transcriptional regulator [Staphylococcus chromogenes]
MQDLSNEHLAKIDGMAQEVLEQVLSESKNYGDAKRSLNNLKIMAKSHFKKEHLAIIYDQALLDLEEKINATLIKK